MADATDDPWDGFVFDENFVKGGVHEPPARTRDAISKYGGTQSSWRQGAPGDAPRPGKQKKPKSQRSARGRMLLTVSVVVAVVVVGLTAYSWLSDRGRGTSVPEAEVAGTIANTVGGSTDDPNLDETGVEGLGPADEVGSCYASDDPTGNTDAAIDRVECAEPHDFELVSYQLAQGDNSVLPADAYWQESVLPVCYRDMISYSGKDRDEWPASWEAMFFSPTELGWSTGDRTVYCMAFTSPRATGSVRDAQSQTPPSAIEGPDRVIQTA